jgi:hypothetical protein
MADRAYKREIDQVAFIIGVRRLRSDVLGVVLVVCSNLTIDLGYTVPSSVRQCPIAQLERPTRRRARGSRVAPVLADDAQPRSVSVSRFRDRPLPVLGTRERLRRLSNSCDVPRISAHAAAQRRGASG